MRIRPMEDRDVDGVIAVATAAFADLEARQGRPPAPPSDRARAAVRHRRLLATDPGGAWVAEDGGAVAGAALALVREGVWGLSLLVVAPHAQSAGVGRELLARARAYGDGARGFVVLASLDPRALRAYVRLGLDVHPALAAHGRPRGVAAPHGVRGWRAEDRAWADPLGRALRGAAHGEDLDALAAGGARLSVLPGRGYAAVRDGGLSLLAAADEDAAATLLAAYLAEVRDGDASVEWLTSAQQWAVRVCVDAGLELRADGAVLTRGELGSMSPYLPNGAYL
jgi:GNAT superfamily N-acetyltransferase